MIRKSDQINRLTDFSILLQKKKKKIKDEGNYKRKGKMLGGNE